MNTVVSFHSTIYTNKHSLTVSTSHLPSVHAELRPPGLPQVMYVFGEPRRNYIHKGRPKNSENNLSQLHLGHQNLTCNDQGANPGLRGEKPVINGLSHGRAVYHSVSDIPRFLMIFLSLGKATIKPQVLEVGTTASFRFHIHIT
jgi:hypothetical protein